MTNEAAVFLIFRLGKEEKTVSFPAETLGQWRNSQHNMALGFLPLLTVGLAIIQTTMQSSPLISFPLVKRPDLIEYNGVEYILFSDPIGECIQEGALMAPVRHQEGRDFDEFWNLQGRGYVAEWIIEDDHLKLKKFLGHPMLKKFLVADGYFKHIRTSENGIEMAKSGNHMLSDTAQCKAFKCFTGEMRLLGAEILNSTRLGWLIGGRREIILTIGSGKLAQERLQSSFFRPSPFLNLGADCRDVGGGLFCPPHFVDVPQ